MLAEKVTDEQPRAKDGPPRIRSYNEGLTIHLAAYNPGTTKYLSEFLETKF